MYKKFFESQQSTDTLKQICEEVAKIREDFHSLKEIEKEKMLFEDLDFHNQQNIVKQLDLNRRDSSGIKLIRGCVDVVYGERNRGFRWI